MTVIRMRFAWMPWILFGVSVLLLYPPAVHSQAIESIERIQQTAKVFLHTQTTAQYDLLVKFGYVDPRTRLPQCEQPLAAYLPEAKLRFGAITVGVQCPGRQAWKIVIPVELRAIGAVVVAQQAMVKDTQLKRSELVIQRRELSAAHEAAFSDISDVEGMILRRPVAQDTVLTASMLKPKRLVQRGELVTIIAEQTALAIHVQGVALMDGHRGQTIRVQNARSGREIHAEVIGPGTVKLKM